MFCCIMTFFSPTSSPALPLFTGNKSQELHIPYTSGLHCCQTATQRKLLWVLPIVNLAYSARNLPQMCQGVTRFKLSSSFLFFRPQSFSLYLLSVSLSGTVLCAPKTGIACGRHPAALLLGETTDWYGIVGCTRCGCIYVAEMWLSDSLTISVEKSLSREADSSSASQEIPRILWNPQVHWCT